MSAFPRSNNRPEPRLDSPFPRDPAPLVPPVVPMGAMPYQEEYPIGHVMHEWAKGWNACIDCITGKAMDGNEPIRMDECDRQRLALAICPELRGLIEGRKS